MRIILTAFLIVSIHNASAMDKNQTDFNSLLFTHKHTIEAGCEDIAGDFHPFCYEINEERIEAHSLEGKALGFVKIDGNNPCTIFKLQVYQFAKGNGVGKKLLEQAVAWSKSQGCTHVSGIVFDSKRDYYQKLGAECNPSSYYYEGLTTCRYTIPEDKI